MTRLARTSSTAPARLSRWEILGAWLHVWTPAKGAEVPPIPWRKVGWYGLAAAVVIAIAAVLIIPPLNRGKREGAAERAAADARAVAAEQARLRVDQRVHRLTVPAGAALVPALESAVSADAKARVAAKTMSGPVISTNCEAAGTAIVQFPASRVYKCFVKTATGLPGQNGEKIGTGYAFVATIYAKKHEVAWCKQNPRADEKGTRGATRIRMSPVCAGKLSEVL